MNDYGQNKVTVPVKVDLAGPNASCLKGRSVVLMVMFFLFLIAVSGCGDKSVDLPDGTVDVTTSDDANVTGGSDEDGAGLYADSVAEEGIVGEDGIVKPPEGHVSEGRTTGPMMPVYFDFDSYIIQEGMMGRMEVNARFLRKHPTVKIEIQGNCDERGTSEYNLALGEKRAVAAKRYLVNLGIRPDRISVVSLGEEKPLDEGSGESAWSRNRRDDFVVVK